MLSSSEVGEFVLAMLPSKFGLGDNFEPRCRVGSGARFLPFDAERDRSVPRCCCLVLDCSISPLLVFRTPLRRTVFRDSTTPDELSVDDVLPACPSCVSNWLSVDVIADGIDKDFSISIFLLSSISNSQE